MATTRRELFALSGLAPFGFAAGPEAPQIELNSTGGLRVVLFYHHDEWVVGVPAFEHMEPTIEGWAMSGWYPGKAIQWKIIPLNKYLAEVEKVCGIRAEST